jgi:hypothetical protein
MARLQELLTQSTIQNLGLGQVLAVRAQENQQLRDVMNEQAKAQVEAVKAQARGRRETGETLGALVGAGAGALLSKKGERLQGASLGAGIGQAVGGQASGAVRQPGVTTGADIGGQALQTGAQFELKRSILKKKEEKENAVIAAKAAADAEQARLDFEKGKIAKTKLARDLRKDFQSGKIIKDSIELNSGMTKIDAVWERFMRQKGTDQEKSRVALDQAIVTIFNKLLDPGSVVRESEFARTPEGASTLNRAQGFVEKLSQGGVGLTDPDRQEIVDVARELVSAQNELAKGDVAFTNAEAKLAEINPVRLTGKFKPYVPPKSPKRLNINSFQQNKSNKKKSIFSVFGKKRTPSNIQKAIEERERRRGNQ